MEANNESMFIFELLEKSDLQYRGLSDMSGISDEAILTFTWVVFGLVCQVIDVFGIVTNIVNIMCFTKQDFKDSVNVSLLGLAVSDLGSLVTLVGLNIMYSLSVIAARLPLDVMEVSYFLFAIPHTTFTRVSSWITAVITLERCLCIIAPLKIKRFVSTKKMTITVMVVFIVLQFSMVPLYVANTLGMKFSPLRNVTILGRVSVEGQEKVESISYIINNFLLPMTAFVIIVICTVMLVIKLQKRTKWRNISTAPAQADRVSSRNQKVSSMVVMISVLFIVCFAPFCITALAVAFEPELGFGGRYIKFGVILGGLGFVLESVNSSVNIFIYYHMSSKYREAFHIIFCAQSTQNK